MEEAARTNEQQVEATKEETTSSSADSEAEPPGSGPRGAGPPLKVGAHHRRRNLCDGGGLCSLEGNQSWEEEAANSVRLVKGAKRGNKCKGGDQEIKTS